MCFRLRLFLLFERKGLQIFLDLLSLTLPRIVLSDLIHLKGLNCTRWLCAALHLVPHRYIHLGDTVEDLYPLILVMRFFWSVLIRLI